MLRPVLEDVEEGTRKASFSLAAIERRIAEGTVRWQVEV